MRLYLLRHGQTDWNATRHLQGQVDVPLNAYGRSLAKQTAAGLREVPFDRCITSPLARARQTAEIILEGRDVPIETDKRIMEIGFGVLEGGCCTEEGWNVPEEFRLFFTDPAHYTAPEGGEDFYDMHRRLSDFLAWIFKEKAFASENILISTHGAALAGLLNCIRGDPIKDYWGRGVSHNCGVTTVEVTDGVPKILAEDQIYYQECKN